MAHTRTARQQSSQPTEPGVNLPAQLNASKTQTKATLAASRSSKSKTVATGKVVRIDLDNTVASLQSEKNTQDVNLKRKTEDIDTSLPESGQTRQPKRTKNTTQGSVQAPARQSARSQTATEVPLPLKKRKRRTKAEILADKARADAEKLQLAEQEKQNEEEMLKMNIEEDTNRAETAARTVRKFSDIENESGEEFVGYNDIGHLDTDSDSGNEKASEKTNKAPQKKIQEKADGGKSKTSGGKKTSIKTVTTYASGLRKDWNKEPTKKNTAIQISTGGVESDVEDTNPYTSQSNEISESAHRTPIFSEDEFAKRAQKATRDLSRRNELVSLASDENEDAFIPHPVAKKAAANIPRPIQVKSTTKSRTLTVVDNVQNTQARPSKGKPTEKPRRLNGNNVRTSDLPDFASAKWRTVFLPTLYNKFFASDQPFEAFYSGSDGFVGLLQSTIAEVYPEVRYTVTAQDGIHFLAYNRINEKRSLIGSNAIKLLEEHLKSLEDKDAVKDWLRWARRFDGPLFFKVPSPINSPTNQRDARYQYPTGRMLSPFIINLAKPFLALSSGSVSDNGFPKGLFALIMAALERAVKHLSKPSVTISEFSKDHWGSQVGIYYEGFRGQNGVPDERWNELVEACGSKSHDSDDDICDADMSLLDNNRALVFGFCSPAKSRT